LAKDQTLIISTTYIYNISVKLGPLEFCPWFGHPTITRVPNIVDKSTPWNMTMAHLGLEMEGFLPQSGDII
jgi:hypothetical protein